MVDDVDDDLWLRRAARGILVPRPRIKAVPPRVEARSLNYRTTRDILTVHILKATNTSDKHICCVWSDPKTSTSKESISAPGQKECQTNGPHAIKVLFPRWQVCRSCLGRHPSYKSWWRLTQCYTAHCRPT